VRIPIDDIGDPDKLTGAELDRAIARRNAVGDILTRSSRTYRDRVAVVDETGGWTYAELEEQANLIAHALRDRGVESREPVAVLAPNCREYLAAYFGIVKAGAVATLLNLLGGPDGTAVSLAATRPRTLFVHPALLGQIPAVAAQMAWIETIVIAGAAPDVVPGIPGVQILTWQELLEQGRLAGAPDGTGRLGPPRIAVADRQVAQIKFSSGSTGNPKGIRTSHLSATLSAMANSSLAMVRRSSEPSVTTVVLPLFHTVALNVMALTFLAQGGRLHLLSGFDPEKLGRTVAESRSTHVVGMPVMLEAVARYAEQTGEDMPDLEVLFYGMAPMIDSVHDLIHRRFPGRELLMASGMTECVPACLAQWPGMDPALRDAWGFASAHADCRVVDPATGAELPAGVEGELAYRGPGVMEGYVGADDNPEVFRDGWLHTGDVGLIDDHGAFWFTDRLKDIVKSGGENVSSVTVERVVLAHPEVSEVAVIGVPDEIWGERVVAVVVPADPEPDPDRRQALTDSVLAHGREHLNSSHRPREVRIVGELPRTGSGKVRKNLLRNA
jgi:acyl-CoA synthetase (AMP-forming)/AMP-acid ligase II